MSMQVVEAIVVNDQHLDPKDVVAYVDKTMAAAERARLESHLAACAECRAEIVDAGNIIATLPRPRSARQGVLISAAGIAAMLLVFLWPRADRDLSIPKHRDSSVTTTVAPTVLAPVGAVESVRRFIWSSVPHSSLYDVRIFDSDGSVVWQGETRDTVIVAPATVALRPGRPYYWKVSAHTGIERSISTELVEFSVRAPPRQ